MIMLIMFFKPFYTSESEIKKDVDCKRKLMTLKELSEEIYDNCFYYEFYNDPESAIDNGIKLSSILEYVNKNQLLNGMIINPDTSEFYKFEK